MSCNECSVNKQLVLWDNVTNLGTDRVIVTQEGLRSPQTKITK